MRMAVLLKGRFNLDEDKAEESEITASIVKNISFRGANLWTLIFAIFIASIGLNVNSAAVIIGAMLISPLMGPIMGVGLGIGINDLDLVRKGLKNLLIATMASIATSALYFWLTPLDQAQSELLARTTPSIWDVFIAFFGGLAGIVAGTRKEKSNVIPGVAIATALMPPLCTAGFGLANGEMYYFFGALYLFFINGLFICIATFLIVRFLRFKRKQFESEAIEKRVSRTILILVIVTVLPSIYLAYRIVDRTIFEANAVKFAQAEFNFKRTQVINKSYVWDGKQKRIELLLIGDELEESTIDSIRGRMDGYNLDGAELVIYQGLDKGEDIDFAAIKASILKDAFSRTDSLLSSQRTVTDVRTDTLPNIREELAALYPDMRSYTMAKTLRSRLDTLQQDSIVMVTVQFKRVPDGKEITKLENWLKQRLAGDSVVVVMEKR